MTIKAHFSGPVFQFSHLTWLRKDQSVFLSSRSIAGSINSPPVAGAQLFIKVMCMFMCQCRRAFKWVPWLCELTTHWVNLQPFWRTQTKLFSYQFKPKASFQVLVKCAQTSTENIRAWSNDLFFKQLPTKRVQLRIHYMKQIPTSFGDVWASAPSTLDHLSLLLLCQISC